MQVFLTDYCAVECNDGTCVGSGSICDGINDCGHWEDEQNCGNVFYTFVYLILFSMEVSLN